MELAKSEQRYTSCYCEENVWYLVHSLQRVISQSPDWSAAGAVCHVVFVSNRRRIIPLWCQSAPGGGDEPCLWDYHVICTLSAGEGRWVYDLDSILPFPCRGDAYVRKALRPEVELRDEFQRQCVPAADDYVRRFSSDRSHMLEGTEYLAAPPPWPPIMGDAAMSAHELPRFWCVEGREAQGTGAPGHLLDDTGFCEWLRGRRILCGGSSTAGCAHEAELLHAANDEVWAMAAAPEVMNLGEDRFSAPDCSKPTFSQHTRWKNLRATRGAEAREHFNDAQQQGGENARMEADRDGSHRETLDK